MSAIQRSFGALHARACEFVCVLFCQAVQQQHSVKSADNDEWKVHEPDWERQCPDTIHKLSSTLKMMSPETSDGSFRNSE